MIIATYLFEVGETEETTLSLILPPPQNTIVLGVFKRMNDALMVARAQWYVEQCAHQPTTKKAKIELEYENEPVRPTRCIRCNTKDSFHRVKSDPINSQTQTAIDFLIVCINCGKLART